MSSRMRQQKKVHKGYPSRLPTRMKNAMSLPLSIFKTPSSVSLPLSADNDNDSNGDESKRKSTFGARRKEPKQSRIFGDMRPSRREIHDQIQAVRVNPQVLMFEEKRPRFETILIAMNDRIFEDAPALMSEKFGIKIVSRPLNNNVDTSGLRLSVTDLGNDAQHLFRCFDANKADHKVANRRDWDHEFGEYGPPMTGSVVLARLDREPLHVLHAMAILRFAQTVISPALDLYQQERKEWQSEETHFEHQRVVMTRRLQITGLARPEEFEKFWQTFKQQTVRGRPQQLAKDLKTLGHEAEAWLVDTEELQPRPEWLSVPSPYQVRNQTRTFVSS
ncbi:hypothetical protein EG327_001430 [Venturia inaequalis]|nr:hypothetical protein EG327_001430 [Venturia inaequalis]